MGIRRQKKPSVEMQVGTNIHDLIHKLGRRWTWETKFLKELEKYRDEGYGLIRKVGNDQIYEDIEGHPDEFQVSISKWVSVVELKTTAIKNMKFYNRWKLPVAIFQTQVYCYILDPILQEMGYRLDKMHVVSVWYTKYRKRAGKKELAEYGPLQDVPIFYYPKQTEEDIKRVLNAFRDPSLIIPPRSFPRGFKCKQCPKIYKERCQFWNQKRK